MSTLVVVLRVSKVVLVQFTLVLKPQGVKVLKDWNFFSAQDLGR